MSDPGTPHIVLTRSGPQSPWVGQMVRIDAALFRPRSGEGELPPFSFDDLDVPGAIALFRAEAPPPSEQEADGVTYLVQHRTLLVFAQEDGEIVLPALTSRFADAVSGKSVRVESEELHFTAALPRGSAGAVAPVVARGLKLESKLDRPLSDLAVGDGFTRTIVLSAEDTDPIMLPDLTFAEPSGLRIYPGEPRALASAERGEVRASRSLSATYVVERVGHYELPELSVRWLDPNSGRYTTARAEALTFWARPNFSLGLSAFGSAPGLGFGIWLGALLSLAALVYLVQRRLRFGPFAWEQRLAARRQEQRAFLAFERALTHAPPHAILERAYHWLALRLPSEPRTLARLRATSLDSAEALKSWERQAFAMGTPSAPAKPGLYRIFARARRALAKLGDESSISEINPHNESRKERS
jgi:hypothetical protein